MNAPEKAIEIKAAVVAAFAFCTALWGWLGWAIIALGCCMALDYLTGTWAAIYNKEWSSAVARAGLWHKLGEAVALLVAIFVDIAISVILHIEALGTILAIDIPADIPKLFTLIVTIWYIFTELGSIIENAGKLGAPVPEWLSKVILSLKTTTDKAVEPHNKE